MHVNFLWINIFLSYAVRKCFSRQRLIPLRCYRLCFCFLFLFYLLFTQTRSAARPLWISTSDNNYSSKKKTKQSVRESDSRKNYNNVELRTPLKHNRIWSLMNDFMRLPPCATNNFSLLSFCLVVKRGLLGYSFCTLLLLSRYFAVATSPKVITPRPFFTDTINVAACLNIRSSSMT